MSTPQAFPMATGITPEQDLATEAVICWAAPRNSGTGIVWDLQSADLRREGDQRSRNGRPRAPEFTANVALETRKGDETAAGLAAGSGCIR